MNERIRVANEKNRRKKREICNCERDVQEGISCERFVDEELKVRLLLTLEKIEKNYSCEREKQRDKKQDKNGCTSKCASSSGSASKTKNDKSKKSETQSKGLSDKKKAQGRPSSGFEEFPDFQLIKQSGEIVGYYTRANSKVSQGCSGKNRKEVFAANMSEIVREIIIRCLDAEKSYRRGCGRLLALFIDKRETNPEVLIEQLGVILEHFSPSLKTNPKHYENLAEILSLVVTEDKISLSVLLHAVKDAKFDQDEKLYFMGEILARLRTDKGIPWLTNLWGQRNMQLLEYVPITVIEEFVSEYALEHLINEECVDRNGLTETFVELLNKNANTLIKVAEWIETNEIYANHPKFISALTTAICKVSFLQKGKDFNQLDERQFEQQILLIKRYAAFDDNAILQSLTAVQAFVSSLALPKGIFSKLYDIMYNGPSTSSVWAWRDSV